MSDKIIKGNEIIVRYLGYHLAQCNNGFAWDWNTSIPENKVIHIQGRLFDKTHNEYLVFHSDWNWLMLVVLKIANSKSWTLSATLEWLSDKYLQDGFDSTEECFDAVVEYIEKSKLEKKSLIDKKKK